MDSTQSSKKKRTKLTPTAVIEIFLARPRSHVHPQRPQTLRARRIAAKHNVCDRTVRDIWTRRSWQDITYPFWDAEEIASLPTTSGGPVPEVVEEETEQARGGDWGEQGQMRDTVGLWDDEARGTGNEEERGSEFSAPITTSQPLGLSENKMTLTVPTSNSRTEGPRSPVAENLLCKGASAQEGSSVLGCSSTCQAAPALVWDAPSAAEPPAVQSASSQASYQISAVSLQSEGPHASRPWFPEYDEEMTEVSDIDGNDEAVANDWLNEVSRPDPFHKDLARLRSRLGVSLRD